MNTNPNAKVVVCYGDSNTWGDDPNSEGRHLADVRWPGVLQINLGNDYEVVNEGLCGRTFVVEDPKKTFRTGITHLRSILDTNEPIDIITVMLGTNDMKSTYNLLAEDISNHLEQTIQFIQKESPETNIIIICPSSVTNPMSRELDECLAQAPELSRKLPPLYEEVAEKYGCLYLDASEFINLENTDGYHLSAEHHALLGNKVAEIVKTIK